MSQLRPELLPLVDLLAKLAFENVIRPRMEGQQALRRARINARILVIARMPLDQLRSARTPDGTNMGGVYILWRGPMPFYIGMSDNVYRRIAQHAHARMFDEIGCTRLSIFGVNDPSVRADLEATLIARWRPRYNRRVARVNPQRPRTRLAKRVTVSFT